MACSQTIQRILFSLFFVAGLFTGSPARGACYFGECDPSSQGADDYTPPGAEATRPPSTGERASRRRMPEIVEREPTRSGPRQQEQTDPEPGPRAYPLRQAGRPEASPPAAYPPPEESTPRRQQASNFAEELTDFGVPAQDWLQDDLGSPTPTSIPGGRLLTTEVVAEALAAREVFALIDTWNDRRHPTIPTAIRLPYAGQPGEFQDEVDEELLADLSQITRRQSDHPLVFFCAGAECWESYNAALRAIGLGFKKVYWYRGGMAAWNEAGFPVAE